mgnify:CR=1 FL=1
MRQIIFHEETKTFHLYNEKNQLYLMCIRKMDIWDNYILENDFMIKQIFLIWLRNVNAQ